MCRSRRELSNAYFIAKFGSIQPRTSPVKFARPSTLQAGGDAQPVEVPGGALDDAAARRSVACVNPAEGRPARPFSAVSKPKFASKYAFESSRRDLHNALLCTALKSYFFKNARILPKFSEILLLSLAEFCKI